MQLAAAANVLAKVKGTPASVATRTFTVLARPSSLTVTLSPLTPRAGQAARIGRRKRRFEGTVTPTSSSRSNQE